MNNWSGGHENTGCLCDITNSFYYKQSEHSTAPKIKLMRRADNKGDQKNHVKFQETTEQL